MARPKASGWDGFRAEHLVEKKVEGDEFQDFCASLINYEATDRHDGAEIGGGDGKSVADGGRDLLLTLVRAPIISRREFQRTHHLTPLTEDPAEGAPRTRIAYSCKSGKWLNKALEEARERSERPVEVLAEGGFFTLLINCPGKLDKPCKRDGATKTPHEHLRDAYWERLKRLDPHAPDPGPRIRIVEAEVIARFLRALQPSGGDLDRWLDRFELTPQLRSLEAWRSVHAVDRDGPPQIVYDQARHRIAAELLDFLGNDATHRVAFIVGRPGVGKTRLVIESLCSDPAIAPRVRVALSRDEAIESIDNGRLLQRHPDLVLVVDDCLATEVRSNVVTFQAAVGENSRARLLVLIPAAYEGIRAELPNQQVWSIEPLDGEHTRTLVSNEIGHDAHADVIEAIAKLSEGFPWFARLLAIEHKQTARAPHDLREAVRWALASRREVGGLEHAYQTLVRERAQALLAVSLTTAVDWEELDREGRERIASAVGLERWQRVHDLAGECQRRGILRRRSGWRFKYVTPQVLEREIVAWLLGPDGTDPGGRTLAEFGEKYLSEFFETLMRLDLPASVIVGIADAVLDDLRSAPADLARLHESGLLGPRLSFLARHRPGPTALAIRRIVGAIAPLELRARVRERRGLVWALEALVLDSDAFEDAEWALFRLACNENEGFANNATATWASLFLIELNLTRRPLSLRLALLGRRLADADVVARLVAIRGVESVLTNMPMRMVRMDGIVPVPRPTIAEAHEARMRAWSLLVERFADPDEDVATAAKKLALKEIRGAVHLGIGPQVMDLIELRLSDLSVDERVLLREKLEEIRAYDSECLSSTSEQPARLEAAVAPQSFGERLRQRVAVWGPMPLRRVADRLDDALVDEGLQGEAPLRSELDWLVSHEAQRSHAFAYAIGRRDLEGSLFEDLRRVAKQHSDSWKAQALLARYLGGIASTGRREQADAFLRALQTIPDEATTAALALVELGATPDDLNWLERELHHGHVDRHAIGELGRRSQWTAGVDEERLLSFVAVLADGDADEHAAAALELLAQRYEQSEVGVPALAQELLERALARLAPVWINGMVDHFWESGAKLLVDAGMAQRVAELAVIGLSRPSGSNEFAWNALHRAAQEAPAGAFSAVAQALDNHSPAAGRLLMGFWLHRQSFDWPSAAVLEWVGDDERRARAAAGLVRIRGDQLPEAVRALLRQFGPSSSVAREIACRFESTDEMVASLAERDRKRLERARHWLDDPDPAVASFAEKLVDRLERSHEHHAAYEDYERQRFGT